MHGLRESRNGGMAGGWSLAASVALFAILCGLVLLLAPGAPSSRRERTGARVVEALGELERATQALDAADYGVARTRVQRARASLTELMPERRASR